MVAGAGVRACVCGGVIGGLCVGFCAFSSFAAPARKQAQARGWAARRAGVFSFRSSSVRQSASNTTPFIPILGIISNSLINF